MYPFSLKLLWAPIVDSIYSKKIGRRKSWMVPCNFVSGVVLLSSAHYINSLLDADYKNQKSGLLYFFLDSFQLGFFNCYFYLDIYSELMIYENVQLLIHINRALYKIYQLIIYLLI